MRIGAIDHARQQERSRRRERFRSIGDRLDRTDAIQYGLEGPELLGRDDRLQRPRGQRAERRVGRERQATGHALDDDERERVEVGARVELYTARLLRRRVTRRSEHRARGLGPTRLGKGTRETEVRDAHDAVLVEQKIRGLDVAVQHAASVRVLERGRDIAPHARRLRNRQVVALIEHPSQRAALEQLEHHERNVVVAPIVHGDDVRVVQRRRELGFGPEAPEEGGVLGEGRVQHLHGHPAS